MKLNDIAALEKFIVDNDDLEQLETRLAQFNIFEAVGMVRQEIRHSNFLAFLLNPIATHRLGDVFLKRFLKRFLLHTEKPSISPIEIDVANLLDAEIRREWKNIDILIHSPGSKIVCAIENKVDSQEHSNQLERYREIVCKHFKEYRHIFIYLTLNGDEPITETGKEFWSICSYQTIVELIDETSRKYQSTIGSEVYTLMNHYANLIRRHIVGDSEIAQLCRKIYRQHKQALDLIYEHRPNLGAEIAEFAKELIAKAKANGIVADQPYITSTRKFIRFTISEWDNFPFQLTCEKWTRSKRILLFALVTELPNVNIILTIGPGNSQIRQAIYDSIAASNISGFTESELEEDWTRILNQKILEIPDPDVSVNEVTEEIEAAWNRFLTEDLPCIKAAITSKFSS